MKGVQQLNITFHNPNTDDALTRALIRIAAEVAISQVEAKIIHTNSVGEYKPKQ